MFIEPAHCHEQQLSSPLSVIHAVLELLTCWFFSIKGLTDTEPFTAQAFIVGVADDGTVTVVYRSGEELEVFDRFHFFQCLPLAVAVGDEVELKLGVEFVDGWDALC